MIFIKRHKKTIFMLVLFIIVFIGGIFLKDLLMPNDDSAAYGTRLEDIKNHPIDEEVYTKMKADLASNSNVLEITHRLQGRTVNIILTVDDKATYQDATKIGDTILGFFSEDTKGYYTIQIFVVKKNKELNNFPIIGIKGPKSSKLSWTPERKITVKEEEGDSDEE